MAITPGRCGRCNSIMHCCGSSGGKAKKILGEPVTEAKEDTKFEQVVHKLDPQSKLLRTWELKGGVSARVTALETLRPDGHTQKMIVRQHGEVDLKHNPHVAADEFKLLQILYSVGLATPAPYHLDQFGEIFSTPYLVIAYIEGKPEFAPSNLPDLIFQLATQLSRIHQVDGSKLDVSFLPQQANISAQKLRARPANVDESLDEGLIRDALEAVWPFPQRNTSVLLHGDFWPGNILWRDGQLVAVIEWEEEALREPLPPGSQNRRVILSGVRNYSLARLTQHNPFKTNLQFSHLPQLDLCVALLTN